MQIHFMNRSIKSLEAAEGSAAETKARADEVRLERQLKETRKRKRLFSQLLSLRWVRRTNWSDERCDNTTRVLKQRHENDDQKRVIFGGRKKGRKKGQKRAFFGPSRKTWSASYGQKMAKNRVLGGRTGHDLYFWGKPRKWPKIDVFGVFWGTPQKQAFLGLTRKHSFLMYEVRSTSSNNTLNTALKH